MPIGMPIGIPWNPHRSRLHTDRGRILTVQESQGEPNPMGVSVQTQKVIIGHEEGNAPDLEPLFANHVEAIRIGADVYVDLGIVKPEDLLAAQGAPGSDSTINFYVLQRVAMSVDTFTRFVALGHEMVSKPVTVEGANK